ncbi:GNAT family N-acetyltransferase [Ralstonia pseudosolanacearum]|uniref:GNAT family N-acetyltransferase n=1 Tax=Ralstonia pseudosolanacearum TaxID=1310165 RepID=UPI003AAC5B41
MSKIIDSVSLVRDPEQTFGMLSEVLAHVQDLKDFYPSFDVWFSERVLPGLSTGDRSILVEYRQGGLAGLAILKDDGMEKKLCCLRVLPGFQNVHGLGVRMFQRAFESLETERPLLSVAEERRPTFQRLFDYFDFELAEEYPSAYRIGRSEFAFNGCLYLPSAGRHESNGTVLAAR